MEETVMKLKGVSALLTAISEVDENTMIANLGMGMKLINVELLECINALEEQVK